MAQSRSRSGITCSSESSVVRGTGIGQPVRWARTESSAHSRIAGYSSRARWATRMSRSVQGRAEHSAPQVTLRGRTTPAGLTAAAPSPAVPSAAPPAGIRASRSTI